MAYLTETSGGHGLRAAAMGFLAGIGQGWTALAAAQARVAEFERLNDMSDAELAARGLTREGIGRHLFRDVLAD